MYLRSFRTMLLLILLIGVLVLSGELAVRAAPSSRHAGRSFQSTGHGIVYPQRINTATLPQADFGTAAMSTPSTEPDSSPVVPVSHPALPPPQNVVDVPPPTTTDPTAQKGLYGTGFKPDANGSGGLDNYLETVNPGVGIYTRSGTHQLTSSYAAWFNMKGAGFFDPVMQWDTTGNRFIFSVLQGSSKNIWLSVAQQSDATGSFCNYSFTTLAVHDFDKLGVDADGIYFSINALSGNQVVNNELFYTSRSALESCQPATYTSWTDLTNPDGSIAQAITPARQDTDAGGVEYLINSIPAGACTLTLWTLTSSGTLSNASVPTQCYSPSPPAKQKGSAALIDSGDSSITQASYVNGLLTVDNLGSYDWGDGNGPVGIVEWYVLNPSTASVSSQGAFGTPGYWLFYPSTITTSNGHMEFVYNASGASIYPSVWYVNQTMTGTVALANGVSYYGTSGLSKWGDYQSAWPDAVSPNSVWITGEYVRAASKTWGTKFDLVTP
jgi:hypothetical protein